MRDLANKTAFVTGGASGIGFGMARAFLDAGMNVAIADMRIDKLTDAGDRLGAADRLLAIPVDVSDRAAMLAAAKDVTRRFGNVHLLCNNAGVIGQTSIDEVGPEEWDWLVSVNLTGVMNGIFAFLPGMKAHGDGGHIVNTSSMAGILPLPSPGGTYTTLKFAVRGLSDSLRLALAAHGIGVSMFCPGLVRSDLHLSAETLIPEAVRGTTGLPETSRMQGGVNPGDAGMDPLEAGRCALEGIRANKPWIFSHGEFVDEVRAEFDAILAAFPRDQAPDEGRLFFEERRREAIVAARHLADRLA
ncbi:SDR family oxidoreductase [Nitrospirillum sp. BR 11163]|uniref:SDR family oxidoreductase n=1 Tax=Nitrospirillum sp. BR 11163 TaxID=3104323 RepID=UPI002AFE0073|nr:SDR family NAD(P)-dependent oxidoreductase [Nitrospirillum sp. BR 11163]MEA1672783.1 SDR family NAD(P)-dependent oxidoreductase [Nitrospirillum sp. BR 11163]